MLSLRENKKEFLAVSFIVFLALVLRFHTIGDRSLWIDEIYQVNFYYVNSIRELIYLAATRHAQPPLDYFIGFLIIRIFPFSEMLVRLPAAIFGTLTVYLVYILTRQLYSKGAAIMGTILTAISSHLVEYSQEARPYAIFSFALLTMLYFYFRALEGSSKLYWFGFGISLYFLLLTRGLEPILAVLMINIISVLYYELSKTTIYTSAASIIAFLFYLPFFSVIYSGLKYFSKNQPATVSLWDNIRFTLYAIPWRWIVSIGYEFTKPVSLLFFIFIALGLYAIFIGKEKDKARIFVSFVFLMPVVHIFTFTYMSRTFFFQRYYIYILPLFYIITGVGIENLWQFIRSRLQKPYLTYAAGFVILIFFIAHAVNLNAYYSKFEKEDWRGVSAYIKQVSGTDSIIVIDSPRTAFGGWYPRFEGKYIYYKGIRDYKIDELVNYAHTHPEFKGDIFLVLYETCCKELCNKSFQRLCVYRFSNNNEDFLSRVEELLDKMIMEYPPNSSRVRLYLAKTKILIYRGEMGQAISYIEKSRHLIPKKYMEDLGRLEKNIKERL